MSFINPLALLGLVAIPAIAALIVWWRRSRPGVGIAHPDLDLIAAADPGPRARRHLPLLLALLAAVALVVALARPQMWRDEPVEQATIMLAIDVSGSMAADDVEPFRLRAAQDAALTFADTVPRQYQVGLVSFSGTANVLVPPTTDRLALERAIEGLVPDGATAVGDAVDASLDAIRSVQAGGSPDGTLESARILLLSDGASTTGLLTRVAADDAARAGVPVFTVSLGTAAGMLPDGTPVPPDAEELSQLSEITGGDAYRSDDAESVGRVYEQLGSFIGTERVLGEATAWPAGIGALLLLAAGVAAWRLGPRLS